MIKKLTLIILVCLLYQNCNEVVKTTFANRNLFVFVSDDNIKKREYFLTLEMHEKIWKYDYDYEVDPDKNIDFKYLHQSDILKFGPNDFISIKGSEFNLNDLSTVPFKKYRLKEPIMDGTGPIFFNPKYGVLAIGNVMGPTIIFLPKKAELKMAKEIFEKTIE